MKFLIALAFTLPLFVSAQDCNLKKGKDNFNNKGKLSSGFVTFQDVSLSTDADAYEIDFFFLINFPADKCFDENSEATVLFEGGKLTADYANNGPTNCKGIFHMIFKNSAYTPSALQKLCTKKVVSIKFKDSNEKLTTLNFNPEQQALFMKMANCIATEAKTLR
jgi:hypothetical protein